MAAVDNLAPISSFRLPLEPSLQALGLFPAQRVLFVWPAPLGPLVDGAHSTALRLARVVVRWLTSNYLWGFVDHS